jgi:hypothetical protein
MEPERDPLLRKCDELIDLIRANEDHEKLRALLEDLEAFRTRLLADPPRHGERHNTGSE